MTRRGRILRDTARGPGLLVVDGTQLPFTLEGAWKSDRPPAPGMVVEVRVDRGSVVAVAAVPEGQLAREQAQVALAAAREKGAAFAVAAVAQFRRPVLTAAAALAVGWLALTAGSFVTPLGTTAFTFWDALGVVHGGGSTGLYGFVAVLAMIGPFAAAIWQDRRAHLLGLLPLLLMAIVAWRLWHLGPTADDAAGLGRDGAELMRAMADRAHTELRKTVSLGAGAYVSIVAASYLALVAVRRYLAAMRGA